MALFRKDTEDQDELAFDLRVREEALTRREREVNDLKKSLDQREAELAVRSNSIETQAEQLKQQGEILVRLKKLIDQRIADGNLAPETVSELEKLAEAGVSTAPKPGSSAPSVKVPPAAACRPSATPKPASSEPKPAAQPAASAAPKPAPEPVRAPEPPPNPETEPAPVAAKQTTAAADSKPPSSAASVPQPEKPAASNANLSVAEKLAALKSKVAQVKKEAPPEPEPEPEKERPPEPVLNAKASPKAPEKVEEAEKTSATSQQAIADKLAALKRKVAQVTKEEAPAAETSEAGVATEEKPPSSTGSIFEVGSQSGQATDLKSKDTTKVHENEEIVVNNELDFSSEASDASIFELPGGADSTVMVPEEITDQIDAELSRTQSQSRLDMHLRGLNERAPEPRLNESPTSEMSVLMADRLKICALARRSEDAITENYAG